MNHKKWFSPFVLFILTIFLSGCFEDPPTKTNSLSKGGVISASITPTGGYALVASVKHPAGFWNIKRHALLYKWVNDPKHPNDVKNTAIAPRGGKALTASDRKLTLWDTRSGNPILSWEEPTDILAVALGPRGNRVLIGHLDGRLVYRDLTTGKVLFEKKLIERINSVAISADGRFGLSGGHDDKGRLWDLKTGEIKHTWSHKRAVTLVALSPYGRYALTSASQDFVKIWDIKSGRHHATLNFSPTTATSAQFSEDGKNLAIATMPLMLSHWDIENAKRLKKWNLPKSSFWKPNVSIVYATSYSSDKKAIYTINSDGNGQWWKIE